MPFSSKLPPDFLWREDDGHPTLYLDAHAVARIRPVGNGWIVETLLDAPGLNRQQVAIRGVEFGRGWAHRWVQQRLRLVANACHRPDLAPPIVHGPIRRTYRWQLPSWAKVG